MGKIKNLITAKRVGFIAVLLLITGIAGLNAYLSDGDEAVNELKVGGVNVEVVEEFDPPDKLEPGTAFTKDVKVKNNGPSECYVRIKAVFTDSDMGNYCTVDWNSSDDASDNSKDYWYNSEDGYYYYKEKLAVGDITSSLFTTVTLSDSIPTAEIKDFDILVYTEAYQSGEFDSYIDAWENYQKNKPE